MRSFWLSEVITLTRAALKRLHTDQIKCRLFSLLIWNFLNMYFALPQLFKLFPRLLCLKCNFLHLICSLLSHFVDHVAFLWRISQQMTASQNSIRMSDHLVISCFYMAWFWQSKCLRQKSKYFNRNHSMSKMRALRI